MTGTTIATRARGKRTPTIAYLEQRVERAAAALRRAESSRIKGVLPAAQRAYRIAVAKLAAARPAA